MWIEPLNPLIKKQYLQEFIYNKIINHLKGLKCQIKIKWTKLDNIFEDERNYDWKVSDIAYIFLLRNVDSINFVKTWNDSIQNQNNNNNNNEINEENSLLEFETKLVNKLVKYSIIDANLIESNCKDITFQSENNNASSYEMKYDNNNNNNNNNKNKKENKNPNVAIFRNKNEVLCRFILCSVLFVFLDFSFWQNTNIKQ